MSVCGREYCKVELAVEVLVKDVERESDTHIRIPLIFYIS